jgi:hypothetical protein
MLGDEGRGIRTIIEMAHMTRLDFAIGSSGLMRQALIPTQDEAVLMYARFLKARHERNEKRRRKSSRSSDVLVFRFNEPKSTDS